MSELEAFVVNSASGVYRWNRGLTRAEELEEDSCYFEEGDAISVNPFPLTTHGSSCLSPVYGEFCEYVTEDIAKVYIPPKSNDSCVWFREDSGEYLIHQGYLLNQ